MADRCTRATRPAIPQSHFTEPKGALLPLGGLDAGHKGFALALLVEALTAGLAGHGRADPPAGWGGTVFVQVLDPEAFGGLAAFKRQMDCVAARARTTPSRGRASIACDCRASADCSAIASSSRTASRCIRRSCPALAAWAQKYELAAPEPVRRALALKGGRT